jgi:5-methylcytosine-specific restriction endonuclease McrA
MANGSLPLKRCCKKSDCLHPETDAGWLPATSEYFHCKKDSKDGFNNKCKACNNAASKAWRIEHAEQMSAYQREYRARNRERLFDWRRGYYQEHRDRYLRQFAEYGSVNADHLNAHRRQRYKSQPKTFKIKARANRRRQRKAVGKYTYEDLLELYELQDGRCGYCGIPIFWDMYRDVHVDHMFPLRRGGSNHPDNICLACWSCNLSKGNKTPKEWREWLKLVS